MEITTERLIIRPICKEDTSDILENINNLSISKYLAVVPYPYTQKDAEEWYVHCINKLNKNPQTDYSFVIEDKSSKKVVGAIGLHDINFDSKKTEIGYWLGEKYQGKGIMSEAVEAVLGFAFDKLELNRIEAHVFKDNSPSSNLLNKFGFKKEGTFRQSGYSKATGEVCDEEFYGLLKSEYKK